MEEDVNFNMNKDHIKKLFKTHITKENFSSEILNHQKDLKYQ
jgi:hypothetical protein